MTPSPSTPPMNPERSDAILGMLSATIADDQDARVAASRRKRTRGIWIGSMATAAVVVAAGVGYGVTAGSRSTAPGDGGGLAVPTSEPAEPTPSSTPTSSLPPGVDPAGTATPVPTPTPTANTPSDVSTWLITTDGVGPLDLGQTFDQAEREFAVAGIPNTADCPNVPRGTYTPKDAPAFYLDPGGDPTISFITILGDPDASGHAARTGGPKTPHGIGVGSTEAELKAAYPNLQSAGHGYWDARGYSLTDGAGKWINFVVSNKLGTVQEIVVNDNNEVPSEFCG